MGGDPLLGLCVAQIRLCARRIAELEADNERLQARTAELETESKQLRTRIAELGSKVATERRAGKRQSAPFSKGQPKTDPKQPGRKPGQAYGRKAHRQTPDHVDEVVAVPAPAVCPDCGDHAAVEDIPQSSRM